MFFLKKAAAAAIITTTAVVSTTFPTAFAANIDAVISAPDGAAVKVYHQTKNYVTEEIAEQSESSSGGTTSHTFSLPQSGSGYTYRETYDGVMTRAGYLDLSSSDKARTNITFDGENDQSSRPSYDTSTQMGNYADDNIYLNINAANYLRMSVGDTFKARAYRVWQIVDTLTHNMMIEPDFTYNVVSGDSIEVTQCDIGGKNAEITAVKDGISVVEVTYDAISVSGTTLSGIYGACDPKRTGVFVVNVGGDTSTAITMPSFDSDFDTVYFLGSKGEYKFKPSCASAMTVKCNNKEVAAENDSSYTLPIEEGNNIVSVSAGNTVEYMIIKGAKISASLADTTSSSATVSKGDTMTMSFSGLHTPIYKFSGIYNPACGWGTTGVKVHYTGSDNADVTRKLGTQFDFHNNNEFTFTVNDSSKYTLSSGVIDEMLWGSAPGAHRNVTDSGTGTNILADSGNYNFSRLPDITVFTSAASGITAYASHAAGTYNAFVSSDRTAELTLYIASYDSSNRLQSITHKTETVSSADGSKEIALAYPSGSAYYRAFIWENNTPVISSAEFN